MFHPHSVVLFLQHFEDLHSLFLSPYHGAPHDVIMAISTATVATLRNLVHKMRLENRYHQPSLVHKKRLGSASISAPSCWWSYI